MSCTPTPSQDLCTKLGDFTAAAWIASGPSVRPADCLGAELDDVYIFGDRHVPNSSIAGVCPLEGATVCINAVCMLLLTVTTTFPCFACAVQCGPASVFEESSYFRETYWTHRNQSGKCLGRAAVTRCIRGREEDCTY